MTTIPRHMLADAVERARSSAARLGQDSIVDVATWQKADVVAAREASDRAYLESHEALQDADAVVNRYLVMPWAPMSGARPDRVVGTYQVQESIQNARTGASDLVRHDLELGVMRDRSTRRAPNGPPLFGEYTGRGEQLGHLSFEELLAMRDDNVANRVLASFAARVRTPSVDPDDARLMATFVDLAPATTVRDGVDVHAGRGLLVFREVDGRHITIRSGKPLAESVVAPLRPRHTERTPDSTTVERITRANPILANVFDRYGESFDLAGASSVILDTQAAARSLRGVGGH